MCPVHNRRGVLETDLEGPLLRMCIVVFKKTSQKDSGRVA